MSLAEGVERSAPVRQSGAGAQIKPRLNRWNGRRSGCASAEPYPASERLQHNRL